MSDRNRSANDLARLSLAVSLMTLIGCGGGGSEEAAPAETPTAGKAETKKSEVPTIKGLGSAAKGRQEGLDATASGGGGAPVASDPDAARKAMMQGQGGPPGGAGRPSEKDSEPASGPGAITPGQLQTGAPSGGGSGGMFQREWVALQVRDKAQVALQAKVQAARVVMFLRVWPVVAPVEVALQVLV